MMPRQHPECQNILKRFSATCASLYDNCSQLNTEKTMDKMRNTTIHADNKISMEKLVKHSETDHMDNFTAAGIPEYKQQTLLLPLTTL